MNNTFCIMPFIHFHATPSGRVAPCCVARPDKYDHSEFGGVDPQKSFEEHLNHDGMKTLRRMMIDGEEHSACRGCYHNEKVTGTSNRTRWNESFKHHHDYAITQTEADGTIHAPKMVYLDFRFSNLCNLACRTCGPEYSTKWGSLVYGKKTFPIHKIDVSKPINENYTDIEEILFAGGEPLMMPEHYELLKMLIQKNDGAPPIRLHYITNLTRFQYGSHNLLDYWRHFKSVHLNVSLDGLGARGEYIRDGLDTNTVLKNLRTVMDMGNVSYIITPTVSVMNVNRILQMINVLQKFGVPLHNYLINILDNAEFFRARHLPAPLKDKTLRQIEQQINILPDEYNQTLKPELRKIVVELQQPSDPVMWEQFKEFTMQQDAQRGQSFLAVAPEFEPYW